MTGRGGAFLTPGFSYQKMRLSALGLQTPPVYVPLLSTRASNPLSEDMRSRPRQVVRAAVESSAP
eukprot:2020049-Pyramimonas_sp.AAC.1